LVIHRFWKTLGFTMPNVLAWFITFNFINISWIFFRAKEWEDALNVFVAMFSGQVILSQKLSSTLTLLSEYGIEFASVNENIGDGSKILNYLISAFFIILVLNNSMELQKNFSFSKVSLLLTSIIFFISIFSFSNISEFLYFNF